MFISYDKITDAIELFVRDLDFNGNEIKVASMTLRDFFECGFIENRTDDENNVYIFDSKKDYDFALLVVNLAIYESIEQDDLAIRRLS